jgi:hypothetical protein
MNLATRAPVRGFLLATVLLAVPAAGAAPGARLPDRLLTCSLRHITNFDPRKQQTAAELRFDAVHRFALRLPPVAVRTAPPPEPFEAAEPVDPRTRIVADPDHIAPQPGQHFERVVDYWPDRVELSSTIASNLLNVIVIYPINAAAGTANMFMTRATELTHFDVNSVFQGSCRVVDPASAATYADAAPHAASRATKP